MKRRIGFLVLSFIHITGGFIVLTSGINLKSEGLQIAGIVWGCFGLISLLWLWLT